MNDLLVVIVPFLFALAGAILAALISAAILKALRIQNPKFGSLFIAFIMSAIAGLILGMFLGMFVRALLSDSGFPTVRSIIVQLAITYCTTIGIAAILLKKNVAATKAWAAVLIPAAVVFAVAWYALTSPVLNFAHEVDNRIICVNHLMDIGLCLRQYADAHKNKLPPSLEDLRSMKDTIGDIDEIITCPSASAKGLVFPHYEYYPRGIDYQGDIAIAWDKPENHNQGRNVLFRSCEVRWFKEEEFVSLQQQGKRP